MYSHQKELWRERERERKRRRDGLLGLTSFLPFVHELHVFIQSDWSVSLTFPYLQIPDLECLVITASYLWN